MRRAYGDVCFVAGVSRFFFAIAQLLLLDLEWTASILAVLLHTHSDNAS